MKRICLILILQVIIHLSNAASSWIQSPTVKHLGVEDGLSNNYVVSLTQDRKGYIWIATESGLNRFDGRQFIVYTKRNSGLSSNELNTVLADTTEDKIWIGTQRDGLCCFDYATETITQLSVGEQGMLTNDITDLSLAKNGGIWVTHYYVGLARYDTQKKHFDSYAAHEIPGLHTPNWTATDDGNGNLYVGHVNKGFSIISIAEKKLIRNYQHIPENPNSLPGNEVFSICIDLYKNVWIGTDKGLALFNPRTEQFTVFKHIPGQPNSLLPGQIRDIKQMKDGSLWIATNMGGISILNIDNNTFTSPEKIQFQNLTASNEPHGLSGPHIRSLLQDSFGNIWIGNYRDGIDFISHEPPSFNTLPYVTENGNKQVWGMYIDSHQRLFVGGENKIIIYQADAQPQSIALPTRRRIQAHVNCIHEDEAGTIWLGTDEAGILLYQPEKGRFVNLPDQQHVSNDIRCFYEAPDGKLWIGSKNGISTYSSHTKRLTPETQLNDSLWDKIVTSILIDNEGKLWVGSFGKGICIFTPDRKIRLRLTTENGFPSNAISQLFKDSKGRIWAATREGAIVFPDSHVPENYKTYADNAGLNNTRVRAICEDTDSCIWISTNGGISQIDMKADTTYNYNHQDGVPLGDFMDASACLLPNGNLLFGSQGGACCFTPKTLTLPHLVAPVTITQFFAYHKHTDSSDGRVNIPLTKEKIKLSYDQNTFHICFNVLDYAQSRQVEFSYLLNGLESTWYDTSNENQAIYRNIPPGNYEFKVRTRFRNQPWEKDMACIKICILPPLWLTWYAKLFYVLASLTIIYTVIRFYKRKLLLEGSLKVEREKSHNEQELNNERLRFYTNITHELRTPLTLILGPLEDLLSDKTLSTKQANKISIIHDSATRLLNLINGILEFRKTETQNRKLCIARRDLKQLVQDIGFRYKELNRNPKVTFHIHIETEHTLLYFDSDVITIILDNLLSNAAKYTSEGEITLTLRTIEEGGVWYTEILVSDTGHGIAPEALPHIFERYYQANSKYQASGSGIGLALAKGLADLHEATLEVSSLVEVGTTFTLRLLTDNTYPQAEHIQTELPEKKEPASQSIETQDEALPILLVIEDNLDICEYIRNAFCDTYEVLTASNGKEGWELAQSRIPNVIVSDIMMPIMNGIELCRLVKEDMRTCHIPVILLTAKDSMQDKEEGYAAGADSYLTKPFSASLLHSRINNLMRARKQMATLLAANAPKDELESSPLNKLDNEFLRRITQIIKENLQVEKMDIAFIADKMCMSHSTLYRKIKGLTDMSANEFIRKIKMRFSRDLLLSGEYTISEIAYKTGFSSVAYFRQCFKNEFGSSPSDYVKKNQ